jgi:hypothetical protein
MILHVAFDRHGTILAASAEGADQPAEAPGVTVAGIGTPAEFEDADPTDFIHLLRVDVEGRRLVRRPELS